MLTERNNQTRQTFPGPVQERILIAFFSWGGNTRTIAREIGRQTGADLFEIVPVEPYSTDYDSAVKEARLDLGAQARPELAGHVPHFGEYGTFILGYPNWWSSIPMPVASFLEGYDFSFHKVVPFCSHGGGRLGDSLDAIAQLVPKAFLGQALAIPGSGGALLGRNVADWLDHNGLIQPWATMSPPMRS
ncbi:MAG: flavodoxin [Deltaproteobacteria bacterium]|jgi:flavodoxin|nr:flavodoxin [Deltaproteobacteria bacterium]